MLMMEVKLDDLLWFPESSMWTEGSLMSNNPQKMAVPSLGRDWDVERKLQLK